MTQDIIVEMYGKVVRLEIDCGTHKEIGFGKYRGELIRCIDCIQWDKFDLMPRDIDGRERHHCPHLGIDTDEYFYCRDGERKEE